MSGGGGEAPPPSSPLNSGEFLLKLLRNPPQQPPRQQAPQPAGQNLPRDPAVAAVGPSISFPTPLYQSNGPSGHENLSHRSPWSHSPTHFAPHNFFLQNPNPNLSSASPPRPGFDQNYQQSYQFNQSNLFGGDDVRKVGPFGTNPKLNSAHQQVQTNLMFGSLPFDIHNNSGVSSSNNVQLRSDDRGVGLGNRIQNGLENEFQKSLELNRNKELNAHASRDQGGAGGSNRWVATPVRRLPPGFSGNPRNVGNKSGTFAQNRSERKGKFGELNNRNVTSVAEEEKERATGGRMSGERRLTGHLDSPGPPTGSNLHSVTASEYGESLSEPHGEIRGDRIRREGDQFQTVLEDFDEQVMGTLVLNDESAKKSDKKKKRDKDYRSDKRGKWILPQRTRFFRRQIECRSDINQLNTAFLTIYESLIPSEEEKAKQKQLVALLEKHVTKEWPKARLHLYGSCANSFGFRKSDIDVCLAIEDADVNKSEVLLKLADILQSDNLQNVQALTHARVPIVKLMDPVTGISCDICVNNLLAVINTKLLRDYAHIDARLRQLAFIVKHWAKLRGVNETYQGTLSSYAYVLMCIHFLQRRKPAILPCLQRMERTYAVNVDNTECAYFDQVEKLCGFGSRNKESIAQLVWAFFSYWAYCHDYPNEVISVRTGCILSKCEKEWTTRIGNDRHLICIEDPFEISHDLGRVVDKYSIRVLREEFERAADIMQNDSDPCVTLFKPYVPS